MRVLHVALYDRYGGACIAGYRQHQALLRAGVDSRMWVRFKVTNDSTVTAFQPSLKFRPRLFRLLRRYWYRHQWKRAGKRGEMFDARSAHGVDMLKGMPEADVLNIQFAWDFLDYSSFFKALPPHLPVVITMHEMATFTGGCSYAESCNRFTQSCGCCPKLNRAGGKDLSSLGWQIRNRAFSGTIDRRLHFVADSEWLAQQARSSGLLGRQPISTIYYGVDTAIFRPLDKSLAKATFDLSPEAKVVAFAAASVSDPRKGIGHLVDSIRAMAEKPFLLTWGRSFPASLAQLPHLHLGSIDSEHLMAVAYNAADVFVMPSLEEAFGQTALESIACGTPVAAFAAGGIPETVRDEQTGLLCAPGDTEGLRANIERLLGNRSLWQTCSNQGVRVANQEFTFAENARKYIELYETLCELGGK